MSLVCRGIGVAYPGVAAPVLRDVSLALGRGRVLGIAGCSGSGKTTLLRCMAGSLAPDTGTVAADGFAALVQQLPEAQLFAPTVAEEVAFGPLNQGLDADEVRERATWALGLLGFDAPTVLGRNPLRLSGGEKRRVAIADMVAMRPEYLLLDEPSAGLDPAQAERLCAVVRELAAAGMGVAVVSHDMGLLAGCADDAMLLAAGAVVAAGPAREVLGDVEALRAAGLEPSAAVELAARLRRRGIPVPPGVCTADELASALDDAKRARASKRADAASRGESSPLGAPAACAPAGQEGRRS